MRFLKRTFEPSSAQEVAAATRLDALTKRGRAEIAAYAIPEEAAKLERAKRLFSSPHEV
jgi:hypothetical protein